MAPGRAPSVVCRFACKIPARGLMVTTCDAVARVRDVSLLTTAAMVAFAANSVVCRAAVGGGEIDAASFCSIGLLSGALALAAIHAVRRGCASRAGRAGSPRRSCSLTRSGSSGT